MGASPSYTPLVESWPFLYLTREQLVFFLSHHMRFVFLLTWQFRGGPNVINYVINGGVFFLYITSQVLVFHPT